MSSNLPPWGKDLNWARDENRHDLSPEGTGHAAPPDAEDAKPPLRTPKPRPQDRTSKAISEAQQGLHSLGRHQSGGSHPYIISPTGAIRNHTRGRIAGPTANTGSQAFSGRTERGRALPRGQGGTDNSLALRPDPRAFYTSEEDAPEAGGPLALVNRQLQTVRDQANLLINPGDGDYTLGQAEVLVSRHAASQWLTRYTTHVIIFLVVGVLVAMGGLKTFTAQGAYPHDMHALSAYTGTDFFGEDLEEGDAEAHLHDLEIVLPKTELNGAAAPTNQKGTPAEQVDAEQVEITGGIIRYTVASGDTIESIAAKHKLMIETVMGSNGIYDPEERLEPGRVLNLPPVDGMYYIAAEGDTVESVARRFHADPEAMMAYPGNSLSDGLKAGEEVVVPGGMMPARGTVIVYTVKRGDSLRDIAARFGIDVPTMLYSNDIPDPDNLQIGSQLRVLPVQGLEYKVKEGDTLLTIANRYGVPVQSILDYAPNKISVDMTLQVGQVVMVPGGEPPRPTPVPVVAAVRYETSNRGATRPQDNKSSSQQASIASPRSPGKPDPQPQPPPPPKKAAQPPDNSPKSGTGKLVWPVRGTITQYFSKRHNGLDIATRAGTPLHAADAGKVIWSGWRNDGLGYAVIIDHRNGMITIYGHMIRQPPVYVGQYVSRGQVIGYIGSTGRSTGPHVHFMVKVGGVNRNPLAYLGR